MQRKIKLASTLSIALLSGAALPAVLGCNREVKQECVPLDATLDYDGPPDLRPHYYCHWGPGELPERPEGYARTYTVSASFIPTEDQPCDPCDVERFEALLHEEVAKTCSSLDYTGLTMGCYRPPEEEGDTCVVMGIFFSNYARVPFEHGCEPEVSD